MVVQPSGVISARVSAMAKVPREKASYSNTPMGPFHTTVLHCFVPFVFFFFKKGKTSRRVVVVVQRVTGGLGRMNREGGLNAPCDEYLGATSSYQPAVCSIALSKATNRARRAAQQVRKTENIITLQTQQRTKTPTQYKPKVPKNNAFLKKTKT